MTVSTKTKLEVREHRSSAAILERKELRLAPLWPKFGANLGTLIRTADAVGASLVMPKLTHKVERDLHRGNTIGNDKVLVEAVGDPISYLREEKEAGTRIVALEIAHDSISPGKIARIDGPTVLVIGHESLGIPADAWEYIDEALELPQLGVGNSLNVIVAASMAAYLLKGLLDV